MGSAIFAMVWLTLRLARGTPIGRLLSRIMVDLPAAALDRITRTQAFWLVAIALLTIVAVCFQEADTLRLVGLAIPDAAAWLTTLEIGTSVEMLAVVVAAWTTMRPKNRRIGATAAWLTRRRQRGTARSPRIRGRGRSAAANDDEPEPAIARAS